MVVVFLRVSATPRLRVIDLSVDINFFYVSVVRLELFPHECFTKQQGRPRTYVAGFVVSRCRLLVVALRRTLDWGVTTTLIVFIITTKR